jgi:hypothetical protein
MKNVVFWDVGPCRYLVNRRSSETSVNKITTLRHIPEDGIRHSHRRENLKSYKKVDIQSVIFVTLFCFIKCNKLFHFKCLNIFIAPLCVSQLSASH